ncbi:MAG: helix-turn-helix domain-containing protein [Candidatus Sericytochromatia bacterium]
MARVAKSLPDVPSPAVTSSAVTPLGKRLSAYRKNKQLTMQELASELGVTESYISFLESGVRSPSRKLLKKMVAFYYPQGNPALQDEWLMLAGFSPENLQLMAPSPPVYQVYLDQVQAKPGDLRAQFALIRSLIRAGELEQAQSRIQACFQLFPGAVEVQSLLGTLELARGHYDNAILAQETALQFWQQSANKTGQLNRQQPGPHLGQADLWLSLGVSCFLKGYALLQDYHRELAKETPQTKATKGGTKAGKAASTARKSAVSSFESARQHFLQALQITPEDVYIWDEYARVSFNLAHLESPSRSASLWKETISAYQKVLKHRDNRLIGSEALQEIALFLGHAYSKSGLFEKAEEILALIQALRPDYALAHYARGCLLSLQAEQSQNSALLNEALEHLSRALQLVGKDHALVAEAQTDPDLNHLRQAHPRAFERLFAKSANFTKSAKSANAGKP